VTTQLPLGLAALLADPRTIIARENAVELADADPAVVQSLLNSDTSLKVHEALAVIDPDDRRELCKKGCGEAVYKRQFHAHLNKCDAVDRRSFPDAQEVPAR